MTTQPTDWYESDAFWETWSPCGFDATRVESAKGEVDGIIERLGLAPGASVLDLCCGIGRHSLELARRGYRVVGVDRNERFLQEARRRTEDDGLPTEFVHADMREFRRDAGFDAAISFFSSFGYFKDGSDDRRVIENLHHSLRPGGRLLMELMSKEAVARTFQPRAWEEHGDTLLCHERKVVDHWRFIESRWTFVRGGRRQDFTITTRCFSAVELCDLLENAGFGCLAVFGDIAGAPYDHEAKRLVVVAEKSDN